MNKSRSKNDHSDKKNRKNAINTTTAPQKLERYRHASHCHKLFRTIVRNLGVFCDNENCKRRLHNNEVTYVCFRCNFDLCSYCFTLPTDPYSMVDLNDSDNEVNEDVLFQPDRYIIKAKTVRTMNIIKIPSSLGGHMEDDDEENCDDEKNDEHEDELEEFDFHHEVMEEKLESQPNINFGSTTGSALNQSLYNNNNNNHHTSIPMSTPMATITFESKDYDEVTTQAVNSLLSEVPGRLNLVAIPSTSSNNQVTGGNNPTEDDNNDYPFRRRNTRSSNLPQNINENQNHVPLPPPSILSSQRTRDVNPSGRHNSSNMTTNNNTRNNNNNTTTTTNNNTSEYDLLDMPILPSLPTNTRRSRRTRRT